MKLLAKALSIAAIFLAGMVMMLLLIMTGVVVIESGDWVNPLFSFSTGTYVLTLLITAGFAGLMWWFSGRLPQTVTFKTQS